MATVAQKAEMSRRTAQDVLMISEVFATADVQRAEAVVLMTHADMFPGDPTKEKAAPYQAIVRAIAQEAAAFPGPVYLFNADNPSYTSDRPLSSEEGWASVYGVPPVHSLSRVSLGADDGAASYLRVAVLPRSSPALEWTKVVGGT
jgi:hypothetical protein